MRRLRQHSGVRNSAILITLALLLVCLVAAACAQEPAVPSAAQNPYDRQFSSLKAEFSKSSAARQALLLARGFRSYRFVSHPEMIGEWLKSVSDDASLDPLVRDQALRFQAELYLRAGNIAEVEAKLTELGVMRAWSVRSEDGTAAGSLRPINGYGPRLWLDVSPLSSGNQSASLEASVSSGCDQVVALRFGSDAAVTMDVNDANVFSSRDESPFSFDQHVVVIRLKPGQNSIRAKLLRSGTGPFRFAARLTQPEGGGVQLNDRTEMQGSCSAREVKVRDLVDIAKAEAEAEPKSSDKRITLAETEIEHSQPGGRDLLESEIRRNPSAAAWVELAAYCADAGCKLSALTEALRLEPRNERAMVAMAEYYLSRKQSEKARGLLQTAIGIEPNDPVARVRLAETYASAGLNSAAVRELRGQLQRETVPLAVKEAAARQFYSVGLLEESVALGRAALRGDFDNGKLRALMQQALGRTRDVAALKEIREQDLQLHPNSLNAQERTQARVEDGEYLQDVHRVFADAQEHPPAAAGGVVTLAETRVEHLLDNGLSTVHTQQLSYIASEQGARKFYSQSIQYSPGSEHLTIRAARLHKANGSLQDALDRGDSHVADKSLAMYYDSVNRELQFSGIEKGDVVELEYTITPTAQRNPYGDYYGNLVVFRTMNPIRLKRFVLVVPASRKLNIVETRMPAASEVTETETARVYQWEARDMDPLPSETHGPSATEIAPYVHVSTFASWDDLGRWYAGLVQPQMTVDSDLRNVAAQIIAGKRTEFEKINAIYQYVLRNTRYVALEFGIYSYKPYPVTQTYNRRFGDCKDKASLMVALMREAGIDADLALLRTRRMGDIDTKAASIALFNHAIVYLPKWDLWLDGTAEYGDSLDLPVADQGAMALVVAQDGTSVVRRVPLNRPEDNYPRRTVPTVLTGNDGAQHVTDVNRPQEARAGKRR